MWASIQKEQNKNIVCGATNFNIGTGSSLPFRRILPAGFKIKQKLRGVTSRYDESKELELGEDDQGLLIFEKDQKYIIHDLFSSEPVPELEITANRGDCLSHIGVAREIAAFSPKLTYPN